jgi:hypothetical protein
MSVVRHLVVLSGCLPTERARSVAGDPPGTDGATQTCRVPAYFTADAGLSPRALRNLNLLYGGTCRPPEGRLIIPATRKHQRLGRLEDLPAGKDE